MQLALLTILDGVVRDVVFVRRQHPNIVQTFTYVVKPCSTSVAQQRTSDE
jgi:hypothetical protein